MVRVYLVLNTIFIFFASIKKWKAYKTVLWAKIIGQSNLCFIRVFPIFVPQYNKVVSQS